ncbi:DNA alkylation repair protein [Patescibacteria group bacterium]|nr:DNA alkylation repair protein [Patescibacteria group bacterium]
MTPVTLHRTLLAAIKKHARIISFDIAHYVGTKHRVYNVPTPVMHDIAKNFAEEHKDIGADDCISLVNSLFHASSFEEKVLATMILRRFPIILASLPASYIDQWLCLLTGWAEVDTFCDEIDYWLRINPASGVKLLKKWNKDPYLEKRRASLVVLCSSLRHSPDPRWKTLAFTFTDALAHEKHVMITKAISWVLRAMVKYHKSEVTYYIQSHQNTLPKIAIREATKKIQTGRKN